LNTPVPIFTNYLFPLLYEKLLSVLRSLTLKEWSSQTFSLQWKVKDVAAHLPDGNIRTISMFGDTYYNDQQGSMQSIRDLTFFLNQ
jgi:hypothetical protein